MTFLADGTQSDALASVSRFEGVAGGELQAVTKGLAGRRGRLIEGKLGGHNGIMEWRNQLSMAFGRKTRQAATNSSAMILGATCAEGVYPDREGRGGFSVNFMPADMDFSEQFLRMDEIIGRREGGRHGYCL